MLLEKHIFLVNDKSKDYWQKFKSFKITLLGHYGLVEIKQFALEIILFEIPLIQVEGFLNLK